MTPSLPRIDEVEDAVHSLGLGVTAAELHGALCGWLAGGGRDSPQWLAQVLADDTLAPPAPQSVLERLRIASAAQLEDREFAFELLVPDIEASLNERSTSLFDWCRGFLGGFGLTTGTHAPLSDESQEALEDLAKLAAAEAPEEGDDEDEAALSEIEEFVRVAVLLLHGDCAFAPKHRRQLH